MRSRRPRTFALVAAVLVLPLLALTLASLGPHEGHGCHFDKDCLTCRWAADGVADAAAPVVQPEPVEAVARLAAEPPARPADAVAEAASSRGPPLA
jgi:hypothetical protein